MLWTHLANLCSVVLFPDFHIVELSNSRLLSSSWKANLTFFLFYLMENAPGVCGVQNEKVLKHRLISDIQPH